MSDTSQGPGWWLATDGRWYPPEAQPGPNPGQEAGDDGDTESAEDAGEGHFGDGVSTPLYEFTASRFKGGRMFSPNIIRVWSDRIEEYEHHALRKKNTNAINYHQVAQVTMRRGLRWADIVVESSGGHVIALKGVPKVDGDRVKGILDDAVHAARSGAFSPTQAPASAPVAAAPQPTLADELLKLMQLRDAGVFTPEEFEVQKAKAMEQYK